VIGKGWGAQAAAGGAAAAALRLAVGAQAASKTTAMESRAILSLTRKLTPTQLNGDVQPLNVSGNLENCILWRRSGST
jgi:hypothetical protein